MFGTGSGESVFKVLIVVFVRGYFRTDYTEEGDEYEENETGHGHAVGFESKPSVPPKGGILHWGSGFVPDVIHGFVAHQARDLGSSAAWMTSTKRFNNMIKVA